MTDADAGAPGTRAVTIFHNPGCSKSRGALDILNERSIDHGVVDYLVSPPSRETLAMIVSKLVDPVPELIRTTDERFIELGVDPSAYRSAEEVIAFLLVHPDLCSGLLSSLAIGQSSPGPPSGSRRYSTGTEGARSGSPVEVGCCRSGTSPGRNQVVGYARGHG